jgi:MraZ protein
MDRFRGSAPARLDEKGRLKVPNLFRQQIEEAFGADMFVTSLHGREVLLYPLPIWRALEEKLATLPAIHRAKTKFLERVNYFGQNAALDGQGRVLIPQILRDAAKLPPDVVVTGNIDHLVVSDRGALASKLAGEDFTPEDYDEMSKLLMS